MLNHEFKRKLKPTGSAAWEALVQVIQNFLGNQRSESYTELVDNMLEAYQLMSARMLPKNGHFYMLIWTFVALGKFSPTYKSSGNPTSETI